MAVKIKSSSTSVKLLLEGAFKNDPKVLKALAEFALKGGVVSSPEPFSITFQKGPSSIPLHVTLAVTINDMLAALPLTANTQPGIISMVIKLRAFILETLSKEPLLVLESGDFGNMFGKMTVPWSSLQEATSTPVPLHKATELYQKVKGSSPGSVYRLLAVYKGGHKLAMKINPDNGDISFRLEEGGVGGFFTTQGFHASEAGGVPHSSLHIKPGGVPYPRIIGAVIYGFGIPIVKAIQLDQDINIFVEAA